MKGRPYALLAAAGLLAVIAAAVWMLLDQPAPETAQRADAPAAPATQSTQSAPVAIAMQAPPIPADLPPPKPRVLPSPEAVKDIEDIHFMLRDFRARLGDNPTGTNAEIMKELMGGNRVQARLGPPEGQKLNDQGELLDRWGTPYFFHQLSKNQMEVRSAGPDGVMWTTDDVDLK